MPLRGFQFFGFNQHFAELAEVFQDHARAAQHRGFRVFHDGNSLISSLEIIKSV